MNRIKYIAVNILETLLRVFPFSYKTGVIKIGHPDRTSPVLITGNYHLTVERVKRALKGSNVYLLIANSRGINVWCAATGGLFSNHDVISILKTSGIEKLVDHRNVILPQLAATGIERKVIKKKTGWRIIWGPVYAKDIRAFIEKKQEKTAKMREVKFPITQRIEMAVAWAFPISFVASLIMLLFWPKELIPMILLIWGLAFAIFISFPLYSSLLNTRGKRVGFIFFDFGRGGIQLVLWVILLIGLIIYSISSGNLNLEFMSRWGVFSLIVVFVLSMDLMGSTPTYKSGLHEDRLLEITFDKEKCKGAAFCEQVCPRNCFTVDKKLHTVSELRAGRCVQCGACIVQCPFDALYFQDPSGEIVLPETIRKYKLNLMGKRMVKIPSKI